MGNREDRMLAERAGLGAGRERGMKKRRFKVVLVVGLVLGALAGGIGWRVHEARTAVPAKSIDELQRAEGMPVRTVVVVPVELVDTVPVSGEVEALQRVAIRPMVSEVIVAIHVGTGERVEKGELLVELDATNAEIGLANAEAGLSQAASQLEKLEAGSRPEEIAAAKARLEEAEALVVLREQEFERQQALYEEQVTELAALEQAENQYRMAKALAAGARAQWELAVAGPRAEDIAAAAAQVRLAEANVAGQKRLVGQHRLESPIAGVVTMKVLEVGDLVDVKERIFDVMAVEEVYLVVDLSEMHRPLVAEGMTVKVTIDALGGEEYAGEVVEINPAARQEDRAFRTKIRLGNEAGRLWPGMYGRAHVVTRRIEGALTLPVDAVRQEAGREYVLVVGEGSVAKLVEVETGEVFGRVVRIVKGLGAGDEVITLAERGVVEGTKVKIQNPR